MSYSGGLDDTVDYGEYVTNFYNPFPTVPETVAEVNKSNIEYSVEFKDQQRSLTKEKRQNESRAHKDSGFEDCEDIMDIELEVENSALQSSFGPSVEVVLNLLSVFSSIISQSSEATHQSLRVNFSVNLGEMQRPKYKQDGNRGCVKDQSGKPASINVQSNRGGSRWAVLICQVLTYNSNSPAQHFEPYSFETPTEKKTNSFEQLLSGSNAVFIIQQLHGINDEISLENVGIRRKENHDKTVRTNKLEKDCQLRCSVFSLNCSNGRWFVVDSSVVVSDKIKCEQPPGKPTIKAIEPTQSPMDGGGLLIIRGSNFQSSLSKVCFNLRGHQSMKVEVIDKMTTKETLVCRIPPVTMFDGFSLLNGSMPFAEIRVQVNGRESDATDFTYTSQPTGTMAQGPDRPERYDDFFTPETFIKREAEPYPTTDEYGGQVYQHQHQTESWLTCIGSPQSCSVSDAMLSAYLDTNTVSPQSFYERQSETEDDSGMKEHQDYPMDEQQLNETGWSNIASDGFAFITELSEEEIISYLDELKPEQTPALQLL